MPINQRRSKAFFGRRATSLTKAQLSCHDDVSATLDEQWREIEASREQWEQEEKAPRELTGEAIRAWDREHKGVTLYAAPDPEIGFQTHETVVTPSDIRHYIKQRSGVDTIVTLENGVFRIKPMHPSMPMGFSVRKVSE